MTPARLRRLALAVAAAALLAHMGLTAGGVWTFDALNYDDPQILSILEEKSAVELVTTSTWYAYKPLYFLSLKVDALFGDATVPVGHVVNAFLHALAVFLLVGLLFDIFGSAWMAGAVGVLLAVHPVHAENVAWFAERKDVLSLVFVLLAHGAYRRGRRAGHLTLVVPAVLLLLGGLTKGTVWSYVGILVVDELLELWRKRQVGAGVGEAVGFAPALVRLLPVLCVGLGGVALDVLVAARTGASGIDHGVGTAQLMAAMAGVHARYLLHLLVPVGLALDYAVDPAGSWGSPLAWLGVLLAVAAVAGLVLGVRRRQPALALGAAFWIFGLAPVNNIWPRTAALMADRYLYLPAIGVYVLVGWLLMRVRSARGAILGVAALLLAVLCEMRTGAFASSHRVWSDTIDKVPHSALARIQRGTDAASQGRFDAALEDADEALRLAARPEFSVRARLLRCAALYGKGMTDALLAEANAASTAAANLSRDAMVRDDPSQVHAQAEIFRGQALEALEELAAARDAYAGATRLDPSNWSAWFNYGTILARSRDEEKLAASIDALRTARDLAPMRLEVSLQLATVYGRRGDQVRALAELERAEARHGHDPDLLYTRATVLLEVANDWNQARSILRQLREVDPDHPKGTRLEADIEVAIGRSRLAKGRDERDVTLLKQAVDHFDEALKILPSHWQADVFAGDAFAEQGRYGEARRRYKDARKRAPREPWIADLIARTAALEAAVLARTAVEAEPIERAAAILAGALGEGVRRLDLGFAPMEDELTLLRELRPVLEGTQEPERSLAAELLAATALLVTGDELSALERLQRVLGSLGGSERTTVLLDAGLVLRAALYERQAEFDKAREDFELLAQRRPEDTLPLLRRLQIELRIAEARRVTALGHADEPERQAQARRAVEVAADEILAFADAHPDSSSAGLLAVQAEINLQRWIAALKRLNDLTQRFPGNPSVYRGFNAVYIAWYTQTRDRDLVRQAEENLRKARALAPRDLRTAMDASQLARIAGDLNSAMRNAKQARELEGYAGGPASRMLADLHVELGRQSLEGGQIEQAQAAVAAARKVDPQRAGSWMLESELALRSPGANRVQRAHELARRAKALEPYNLEVDKLLARCRRGSATAALLQMGRYKVPREGSRGWAALQALAPEEREKRMAALIREEERYRQQAVRDLRTAVLLDPEAEDVRDVQRQIDALEASSTVTQQERVQGAIEAIDRGRRLAIDGDGVGALYAYWDAVKLQPQNRTAHLRLAQTAVQLLLGLSPHDEEEATTADKYARMAEESLLTVELLDPEGRFVARHLLQGFVATWRWRHAAADAAEVKEVYRLAAIAALEHYLLRQRAAGHSVQDDPMMGQAVERLETLRKGGD